MTKCEATNHACSYAYKHGCRCLTCVTSHRERCYRTRARARERALAMPDGACKFPKHKAYTGYQYGCRCDRCRKSQAVSTRRYRRRMRAKIRKAEKESKP